jgi:WD40 repeat protein
MSEGPGRPIGSVAFAPNASLALAGDGRVAKAAPKGAAQGTNPIQVWDLARGEAIAPLVGHTGPVTGLTVSADGKTAFSVSDDETVAIWDLARGRRTSQSPRQPLRVIDIGVSPDGARALVVYPGLIVKVDLEKFRAAGPVLKTAQLTGSDVSDVIRVAAVSSRGQGLVGGLDGKLYLLDLADKAKPRPLTGHREAVRSAAFVPAGDVAATGGGGILRVGTLRPGQENLVCLWDAATAELRWKAEGHVQPVVCVAFSPDGKRVATGDEQGEIRVWDVMDGKPIATLNGHDASVLGLVFTPDGNALWSGSSDLSLRKWRLP